MFGSPRPKDELRDLLKAHIDFSEVTADAGNLEKLNELAVHLHIQVDKLMSWTQGLSRPSPPEEYRIISLLKALKNFA